MVFLNIKTKGKSVTMSSFEKFIGKHKTNLMVGSYVAVALAAVFADIRTEIDLINKKTGEEAVFQIDRFETTQEPYVLVKTFEKESGLPITFHTRPENVGGLLQGNCFTGAMKAPMGTLSGFTFGKVYLSKVHLTACPA